MHQITATTLTTGTIQNKMNQALGSADLDPCLLSTLLAAAMPASKDFIRGSAYLPELSSNLLDFVDQFGALGVLTRDQIFGGAPTTENWTRCISELLNDGDLVETTTIGAHAFFKSALDGECPQRDLEAKKAAFQTLWGSSWQGYSGWFKMEFLLNPSQATSSALINSGPPEYPSRIRFSACPAFNLGIIGDVSMTGSGTSNATELDEPSADSDMLPAASAPLTSSALAGLDLGGLPGRSPESAQLSTAANDGLEA